MASYKAEQNMLAAIPAPGAMPLSANQIANSADRPRMGMRDAEAMLDWMVARGELDCTVGPPPGLMKRYRYSARKGAGTMQEWRGQNPEPKHGCGHMQGRGAA